MNTNTLKQERNDLSGYNEMKFIKNKYNENKKYIFVHIPKNGGSSLERMLNLGGGIFSIKDFSTVINIDDYYKFTIVRNPFDKMVSAFTYLRSGKERVDRPYFNIVKDYKDVNDFLKNYLSVDDNLFKIAHFTPQNLWLKINGVNKMDYVGRLENYNDSVKTIFDNINVNLNNVIHTNKSNRGGYKEYFNDESIEIMNKLYKDDLKEFGYGY